MPQRGPTYHATDNLPPRCVALVSTFDRPGVPARHFWRVAAMQLGFGCVAWLGRKGWLLPARGNVRHYRTFRTLDAAQAAAACSGLPWKSDTDASSSVRLIRLTPERVAELEGMAKGNADSKIPSTK